MVKTLNIWKKENLKALEVTKNDELSLIPTMLKREIKITVP